MICDAWCCPLYEFNLRVIEKRSLQSTLVVFSRLTSDFVHSRTFEPLSKLLILNIATHRRLHSKRRLTGLWTLSVRWALKLSFWKTFHCLRLRLSQNFLETQLAQRSSLITMENRFPIPNLDEFSLFFLSRRHRCFSLHVQTGIDIRLRFVDEAFVHFFFRPVLAASE